MRPNKTTFERMARGVALVLLVALAAACAKPTAAERLKQHRENTASAQRYIRGLETYEDEGLTAYLASVMARLARASDFEPFPVSVLDVSHANAYVSERDGIRVTRGMLALISDEAELAVVLGHEIAHLRQPDRVTGWSALLEDGADAEDLPKRLASVMQARELDADRVGIEIAARAGYDTGAARRVIAKLSALEQGKTDDIYIRSHPFGPDRIARLPAPQGGESRAERYRKAVDGLPFGGWGQNFFLHEGRVLAPFLKLSFPAPAGMTITEQDGAYLSLANTRADMTFIISRMSSPDQDSELTLRRRVYEILDQRIGLGALREIRRSRSFKNGSTITAKASVDDSEPSFSVRLVMIAHEGEWLSGMLFHPARRETEAKGVIDAFVSGLREESPTDVWRLRIRPYSAADRVNDLARDWAAPEDAVRIFREINDLGALGAPETGRPIKTISRR